MTFDEWKSLRGFNGVKFQQSFPLWFVLSISYLSILFLSWRNRNILLYVPFKIVFLPFTFKFLIYLKKILCIWYKIGIYFCSLLLYNKAPQSLMDENNHLLLSPMVLGIEVHLGCSHLGSLLHLGSWVWSKLKASSFMRLMPPLVSHLLFIWFLQVAGLASSQNDSLKAVNLLICGLAFPTARVPRNRKWILPVFKGPSPETGTYTIVL